MPNHQSAIELVSALAERYQISAIRPLLETCWAAVDRSDLIIAVLGRFKAGKSSFLNDFIGRDVLPIGVIPVTSVVTEVCYGPADVAEIQFGDGRQIHTSIARLQSYVSEAENPRNEKHVLRVGAQIPELSAWSGIRFVDTPGLESAFAHNTEASLAWAPNADVALVAVGVDPPLSQQDIELIAKLFAYTPRIAILLTKVDLLSKPEQREVIDFVSIQLARNFEQKIPVFPYSTRSGYDQLRREFEQNFMAKVAQDLTAQRHESVRRKIATLVRECEDYLRLALKSAEMLDSERLSLQRQTLAEKDALIDTRLSIQLAARNAAGGTRKVIDKALAPDEQLIRREILEMFDRENLSFPRSFARMLEAFDKWLNAALSSRLMDLSGAKRSEFIQPLADVQRQYQRLLQSFRDRLAERAMTLYGVPLRTTEPDITPASPKKPDVKVGRPFDHSWELLSPLIPMFILRKSVSKRFRRKIGEEIFKNLSRLTSQWEEIVTSAVFELQREAERRVEDFIMTVERLTSTDHQQAPRIREDLEQLETIARLVRTKD